MGQRLRSALLATVVGVGLASAQTPTTAPASQSPAPGAESQTAETPTALETPFDVLHNQRPTGDWWGARRYLEDHGIKIDWGLTTIYQHNAKGGLRTHNAHRVSGSYDLEMTLDTEALKLWKGGTLYAYAEGSWDEGVSRYVGDHFGVNYDALGQQEIQLSELWYEQKFLADKLRLRFGKLDLCVDFDTNAFANDLTTQFLNAALNNTGNLPFPDRGHGLQFVVTPCEWFYFGAGIADAEADAKETGFNTAYHGRADFFSIYEFGITPVFETPLGKLPGQYRFGLWYDPQPKEKFFDDLGGRLRTVPLKRDDVGFYVSLDQVVLRENPEVEGDEQGLGLFARYGFAHGDVNTIEDFWSAGGQYQGLIPTRDDDVLAFGAAQGILSEQLKLTEEKPRKETVLEVYYRIQLLPWLALSPDFQWILSPGGLGTRDAFVAGLRLQATF